MFLKKKTECKECKKLKEKIAKLEYQLLVARIRVEFREKAEALKCEIRALQALDNDHTMEREEES